MGQRGSCALSRGPLPRAHGHGARLSVRAHDLQGVLHATSSLETDARMGDSRGTVIIGGHPLQCRQRAAPVHRQHRVKVTALCGHCDGYAQVGRACDDGKLQCRLHNNRNDKLSGTAVQRCSGALEHTVHWKCAPSPPQHHNHHNRHHNHHNRHHPHHQHTDTLSSVDVRHKSRRPTTES